MTEGSKSNILGLDGSTRVNTSTATINNPPSNFNLQTIVNAPVLKERSSNEDGAGYYVDRKSTTLSPTDKPLIVQQQGRGFIFRGSQYEPLKQSAVAIGVGVNDKAVIFSPYNFIDEPDLNQNTTFSSKRNEDAIKSLDRQSELESKSSTPRLNRYPKYIGNRVISSAGFDQFGEEISIDDAGINAEPETPSLLQDPEKNSDKSYSNSISEKTFKNNYEFFEYSFLSPRKEFKGFSNSYLLFSYSGKKIFLPFFENPIIEERRGINYSITPVYGSSDPLISYNNTELANLKVTFKLNAYHISSMLEKFEYRSLKNFIIKSKEADSQRLYNKFFNQVGPDNDNDLIDDFNLNPEILLNNPRNKFLNVPGNYPSDMDPIVNDEATGPWDKTYSFTDPTRVSRNSKNSYYFAQELICFWINTIKSHNVFTNLNNSTSTTTNPNPTRSTVESAINQRSRAVILRHGPAFYKIAGLLMGYEIKESPNASFDVPTNMANSYEITLNIHGVPELWNLTELPSTPSPAPSPANPANNRGAKEVQ